VSIQSFDDKRTEEIWDGTSSARTRCFPQDVLKAAQRKLDMLNASSDLRDLKAARGNRLEPLKGKLSALHSIRINDQWRIIFQWTSAGPAEVTVVDYH
jgi:proteic killer suppression protein